MDNVFTSGTKGLPVNGSELSSHLMVPANEDWCFHAEIISYDDATGIVELKKIFDLAETPTTFYAWARYLGRSGTPTADEVVVGSTTLVQRCGKANLNPEETPTEFELNSDAPAATAISFAAFFFKECSVPLVPISVLALMDGEELALEEVAGVVSSPRPSGGDAWFTSNLLALKTYTIIGDGDGSFSTTYETVATPILMLEADTLGSAKSVKADCDATAESDKFVYSVKLVPGQITTESGTTICYVFCESGDIIADAMNCCDDEGDGEFDPPADPGSLTQVTITVSFRNLDNEVETRTYTAYKSGSYNSGNPEVSTWYFASDPGEDAHGGYAIAAWLHEAVALDIYDRWRGNFDADDEGTGIRFSCMGQGEIDPDTDAANPYRAYSEPGNEDYHVGSTPQRFISFKVTA